MIRVNLLGEAKKKKRAKVPTFTLAPAGGGLILGILLGVIVIAAGVQWFRYNSLVNQGVELDKQIADLQREKAELAQVQSQYETFSKRKELLTARINVIEQLKAQQAGPVLLLSAVATSVTAQDTLWLTAFDKKADKLTLNGTALSLKAVADLMTRLEATKQFKAVDLKETLQDTRPGEVETFTFALDLTIEPPAPPATGTKPAAPKA
jgi:type IV pilus assembly protein PilN